MASSRKSPQLSDLSQDIPKPQIKFEDKINNYGPFVPRIKYKPNALDRNPLPKVLIEYNSEENDQSDVPTDGRVFQHPYKEELETLEFSEELLKKVKPQESVTLSGEPCEVVCHEKVLMSIVQKLEKCKEIAVDLEGHSYNSYQGFTCLLQISSRAEDFLIDALALRSHIHHLNRVFTDPNIVKVLHGSRQDILWLQRDFGVYVVNLFDTEVAARVAGHKRTSLNCLLSEYCGVESKDKKKMQMADWRTRPLSIKKRKYAQRDTHYLLYIYDILKNKLLDIRGSEQTDQSSDSKLLDVFEQSREICLKKYKKPSSDAFIEENGGKLKPSQSKLLQLLCEWREDIARELDESMGYVMPNAMLLKIVNKMSSSVYKLFPQKQLEKHPLIEVHAQKIAGLLKQAREFETSGVAELKTQGDKPRENSLKKHIYFSDSDDEQTAKKVKKD